jgi:predicted TIM-barrel fold metal-dependent hydrolase
MSQKPFIDAHQHVWKCSEREYSWITPDITHLLGHGLALRVETHKLPSGLTQVHAMIVPNG